MKKLRMRKALFVLLYVLFAGTAIAQKADSTSKPVPGPQWGIEVNYSLMSYTESGVMSAGIVHTRKKHAFALGTHMASGPVHAHRNMVAGGRGLHLQLLPIGSHRMFAPYLFYDLNYGLLASRRDVMLADGNGNDYNVVRQVDNHTLAHHFGLGVRGNIHRKFFAHLVLGAGPATYGDVVTLRSRQAAYPDTHTSEHPFTHFEPAYMLRIGIVYQLEGKEWTKKKGSAFE